MELDLQKINDVKMESPALCVRTSITIHYHLLKESRSSMLFNGALEEEGVVVAFSHGKLGYFSAAAAAAAAAALCQSSSLAPPSDFFS